MLFTNNPIKSRVLAAINKKIADVEKEYEVTCKEIDAEAEEKKVAILDEQVNSILTKIM